MNWKEELKWQKNNAIALLTPTGEDIFLAGFAAALTIVGIGSIATAYAAVELVTTIVG